MEGWIMARFGFRAVHSGMEAEVAALRVADAPQVRETAAARLLQVRDLSARAEVRANLLRRASSHIPSTIPEESGRM